jgi:hypothetical protein
MSEYEFTDYGSAEQVLKQHGANFRYVKVSRKLARNGIAWVYWNGKEWERDASNDFLRRIDELAERYDAMAKDVGADNLSRQVFLQNYARRLRSWTWAKAILRIAHTHPLAREAQIEDFKDSPKVVRGLRTLKQDIAANKRQARQIVADLTAEDVLGFCAAKPDEVHDPGTLVCAVLPGILRCDVTKRVYDECKKKAAAYLSALADKGLLVCKPGNYYYHPTSKWLKENK